MDHTFFKQVGNNIQNVLVEKDMTQQSLANRLNISKQVMSKIIAGSKAINVAEISEIASVLEVSTDSLLSVKPIQSSRHQFSFMGQVKDEATQEKILMLQTVIDEMLMLEEYANE